MAKVGSYTPMGSTPGGEDDSTKIDKEKFKEKMKKVEAVDKTDPDQAAKKRKPTREEEDLLLATEAVTPQVPLPLKTTSLTSSEPPTKTSALQATTVPQKESSYQPTSSGSPSSTAEPLAQSQAQPQETHAASPPSLPQTSEAFQEEDSTLIYEPATKPSSSQEEPGPKDAHKSQHEKIATKHESRDSKAIQKELASAQKELGRAQKSFMQEVDKMHKQEATMQTAPLYKTSPPKKAAIKDAAAIDKTKNPTENHEMVKSKAKKPTENHEMVESKAGVKPTPSNKQEEPHRGQKPHLRNNIDTKEKAKEPHKTTLESLDPMVLSPDAQNITIASQNLPPLVAAPLAPSPQTPASSLTPETYELFQTMVGLVMIKQLSKEGMQGTQMEVSLTHPDYAKSPFYGLKIIVTEYKSAPGAYNIELQGSYNQNALLSPQTAKLISAFGDNRYNLPFTINRLEITLRKDEKDYTFKRKDSMQGGGQDHHGQSKH